MPSRLRTLTISADDFGLHPSYDDGILTAARVGAIDAAGVMVLRAPDRLADLVASGVAVGLHLEAAPSGQELTESAVRFQSERFRALAGRSPAYLDGHHHCHAAPAVVEEVTALARELGVRVRSVDARHRAMLRAAGVATPDLLVGRYDERHPVVPAEVGDPPEGAGWIEWMVHPGRGDPGSGSRYDRGREEDLEAVLSFTLPPGWRRGALPE